MAKISAERSGPQYRFLVAILLIEIALLSPVYAFNAFQTGTGMYWHHATTSQVPYYINLGSLDGSSNRLDLIQGIRNAFAHVASNPFVHISFAYGGTTALLPSNDNVSVVYLDTSNTYVAGSGATFNYKVLSDGTIIAADIALNGNTHASSPYINLYGLALHELCHFLGLDHSSTGPDSAVYANTINMSLSVDDIAGLATLYPNPTNPLSAGTGTIKGRVLRWDGDPMSARVVAYNPTNPQPRTITSNTDTNGLFSVVGLPTGSYRLVAETRTTTFVHAYAQDGLPYTISPSFLSTNQIIIIDSLGYPRIYAAGSVEENAYSPLGSNIYATGGVYGPLRVHPARTNGSPVATLSLAADDLALSPDSKRLYVVDQINRKLHVVDCNPTSATLHQVIGVVSNLPSQPTSLVVTTSNIAYVSANSGHSISAVKMDTMNVTATIPTARYNQNLSLSRDGLTAFVGGFGGPYINSIMEIDINPASPAYHTIVKESPAGTNGCYYVEAGPGTNIIFQGTRSGLDVRLRSDNSLLSRISCGRLVSQFAQVHGGQFLVCLAYDNSELRNNQVWLLDTTTYSRLDQLTLGGSYDVVHPGTRTNEVLVSGNSGLARVEITPDGHFAPSLVLSNGINSSRTVSFTTMRPYYYALQRSTDLVGWTSVLSAWGSDTATNYIDGTNALTPAVFYRVKMSNTP